MNQQTHSPKLIFFVILISFFGLMSPSLSKAYARVSMQEAKSSFQAVSYPIVDTGVQECYSNTAVITCPVEGSAFYGQDGSYAGNQPSYSDNGDGTVTDNVTGLMWQQDMGSKITFDEAFLKADALTLGGHSDWRIPTLKELYSLILFTGRLKGANAEDLFINETYFVQPLGDTSIGEREIDAQTWSSTEYLSLTMRGDVTVFGVNFIDGRIKGYPRYQPPTGVVPRSMYFRMVRGNTSYGLNNFVDNGDGTVTDLATGLMWQQADDGNTRDWEDALEYAEGSSLGGFEDWRLPNSKELQSIVDYTRSPDVTHSAAIDPIFSATSFSDPDGNPGQYGHYWTGSPLLDGPNPYLSAGYVAFGEAQGRLNGNLMDAHGAGAARSDPKTGDPADYPQYHGPQGDVQYVFNYVRIVRDANVVTSSESGLDQLPDKIQLDQNYPNPFNPQTLISFSLPESGEISLKVFDLLGRVVASLASGTYTAGSHSVSWRANDRPGGRYFYSLETASAIETKSMILIK